MRHASSPELTLVWLGGLVFGGLVLYFLHVLRESGAAIFVSRRTRSVLAAAAWTSWALNAAAAVLGLLERFTASPLPISAWVLGAALSPMAIPITQMSQIVQVREDTRGARA